MADAANQNNLPEFSIQRIYVKDLSYEAPHAPLIFREKWEPHLHLDLNTQAKELESNVYEVELKITATVKSAEQHAFVVEVKQAGIFTLKNFNKEQLDPMLGAACPAIIFPYVREVISDVVTRGGFPQLCLAPINFDAIYTKQLEARQQQSANEKPKEEKAANETEDNDTVH